MLDGDAERVKEDEEYDEPEKQLMFHRLPNEVPDDKTYYRVLCVIEGMIVCITIRENYLTVFSHRQNC